MSGTIDSINTIAKVADRIQAFEEVIKQSDTIQKTERLGALFHEVGRSYYKAENYEKALFNLSKAIEIKHEFSDKTTLNKSLFLKAFIYQRQEKIAQSYQMLLEIISANQSDLHTCYAYKTLAEIETEKGDFYKALGFLNKALSNETFSNNNTFKSELSRTILWVYGAMYESGTSVQPNRDDLAIVQLHQKVIEENIEIIAKTPFNLASTYNNLGIVYDVFGEFENSLKFYKKAQSIYKDLEDSTYELLDVILNIGVIYSRQKKHTLANQQYQRVINESDDIDQIANAYDNMGYYQTAISAEEKLPYFEKAISIVLERENILQEFQLPTLAEIKQSGYEQDILIYLIDLVAHYVQAFKQEKEKSYLIKAKKTVTLIDQLVSLIRYETDTEASKLFWIEKGVNTYVLAVEICYLLNDTASAFYFMEKNKALLLQENIKTFQTKLTSDIPKESLEREYQLHYDVLTLEEVFQQHLENAAWKEKYSVKNKEYQTFMDSMKRVYPEYIKTKQKVAITSLEAVMEEFSAKETAFVEYILHETDGYGIYYDTDEPIFFKISDVPAFQKQLKTLQAFMTKRRMKPSELKAYQEVGYHVFQQLFPFENAAERLKDKKITIIPDEALQYIPFELLPTQQSGKLSEVYFVNTVETSYLQSFSLFQQIKQKQNSPTQKLLAIAPNEFEDSTLPTLTGTEKVLEFLSKYDVSVLLTKEEASKENFLKYRNDFEIIHFNTHAGLDTNTQTPWIAFNEEKMSLNELFGLENQADLVILDACKTDDGINLSGEGRINLSRGFFYNGTQSVLASQWNVNEQAGNEILQEFYTEIEKGTTKSKALQLAKLAYLTKHDRSQNTPYYWAAFTLTGSTNSLTLQPVQNYTYIVIGIAILVFLVLFFYYRKKILA
ncbi:CHAT domain-containing protein [Kordia sp. YSTF-M3]|uniref:CHAT domain-containing protein n=1 Tax=Kordia aestuariivivens TaxID=2759037 RepID=A0ABR7Q7R9_9FLAO|nr:CHAT domain-containing tetratricopeptide repeat protein [Kordia aestuariivivens]MBC8754615.1 CHAT domain-containing protein [Kordia aestuariivivens]